MPAWLIWVIAAGVLTGAETLSMDFVLVMCAGGAAAGALAAAAGAPAVVQVLVAAFVAIGLLAFVRPVARRHLAGEAGRDRDAVGVDGGGHLVLHAERAAVQVAECRLHPGGQEREQGVPGTGGGARRADEQVDVLLQPLGLDVLHVGAVGAR